MITYLKIVFDFKARELLLSINCISYAGRFKKLGDKALDSLSDIAGLNPVAGEILSYDLPNPLS